MPKPLVILFWIWLFISVCIYLSRLFRRMTSTSTTESNGAGNSDADGAASDDDLPLDSPDRWTRQSSTDAVESEAGTAESTTERNSDSDMDASAAASESLDEAGVETKAGFDDPAPTSDEDSVAQPVPATPRTELRQEPAVAAAIAEQARHDARHDAGLAEPGTGSADDGLPVGDIAARLDPLVEESHIEPSVLSAMSPTQRAAMGITAATATGGLFDPQVRTLVDDVEYDHAPLSELLTGIVLPCDLIPALRESTNDHYAVFSTTSAGVAEVAAKVASQLEELGFTVSPRPPSGARATRDTSAIDIVVTLIEDSNEHGAAVEIEFSSL